MDKLKLKDILASRFVDTDTKINLRFWKDNECTIVSGYFFEFQIVKHDGLFVKSFSWYSDGCLYIDIVEDHKVMSKEDAQTIVNNQGFAWTVTEVLEGDRYNIIYCDWNGKEHLMYYSNNLQKVVSIL